MAEEQDRAAIATVQKLVHRVAHYHTRCDCPECTALRRVCVLATEALDMKAARIRKAERDRKLNR